MSDKTLLVTPRQKENAEGNKAIGILTMGCIQFLELTVPGSFSVWMSEQENIGELQSYNEASKAGRIGIMPFLDVDIDTGTVQGHEGRHRAAAVLNAGGSDFPVAICLRRKGYKEYYEQPFIDNLRHPKMYYKRYLGINDIPARFLGQFKSSSVRIKPIATGDWEPFYSKSQTELPEITAAMLSPQPVSDLYKKKGH